MSLSRLDGRSYRVSRIDGDRRFLTRALQLDAVRDGVIQGATVRLVRARSRLLDTRVAGRQWHASIEPTPPRFEDAFIDLLGGGPGGHSVIAERMDKVETTQDAMVECRHLTKRLVSFTATDDVSFAVKARRGVRLAGSEWCWQVNHLQDVVRPAAPDRAVPRLPVLICELQRVLPRPS